MQFVSVDLVFHEKCRIVKFLGYISHMVQSNTEQFIFNGQIEVGSFCYTEPKSQVYLCRFAKLKVKFASSLVPHFSLL